MTPLPPVPTIVATTSPSFETKVLSDRSKPVVPAAPGEPVTWTERMYVMLSKDARDRDFNRLMVRRADQALDDHYNNEDSTGHQSFETQEIAGSVDVKEEVTAASPDIIATDLEAGFSEAGMAHPVGEPGSHVIWSRRLKRPLAQADVFVRPPDLALRRLGLTLFDNRENIDLDQLRDGLSLTWDRASVTPAGISWSFGSYELGGYLSAGSATIGWVALQPYLRRDLPFAIPTIRNVRAPGRPKFRTAD